MGEIIDFVEYLNCRDEKLQSRAANEVAQRLTATMGERLPIQIVDTAHGMHKRIGER